MRYSVKRKFKPITPRLGQFNCRECGKDFEGYYTYNRLVICSDECRDIRYTRMKKEVGQRYRAKHLKTPKPRECYLCFMVFQPRTRTNAKFCTPKCYMRARNIQTHYDITLTDYHNMLAKQRKKCAGCLLPFNDLTPFVDHDHETGRVRGLLHRECNSILGFVNDDIGKLANLINYLRQE